MGFSLLNDEPVSGPETDLLGAGTAARTLADLLDSSRETTPFTLAVDAGWGMGKSSLMRLVEDELRRRPGVETAWYNAWTSNGTDALEGVIKSVLMRFDRRVLRRAVRRLRDHEMLFGAMGTALSAAASPLGAGALVDRLWQQLSADANSRNTMPQELRTMAGDWARSAGSGPRRTLVVFIDDLDRCSEQTILAVCEAVKVYLDVPGLAFVVGCDRSALGPAGLLNALGPSGTVFMEKIFQTSYRMPVPTTAAIEAYVRHCAMRSGLRELLDEGLVRLIADRSARNPRRIKRLINGFGLESALNPTWSDLTPEAVLRTLLLQHLYPDFYRELVFYDGGYTDLVREFADYRVARRVLESPADALDEQSWQTTVTAVTGHGLVAPDRHAQESWEGVLALLEENLPTYFPKLSRDQNFIHLIEEWMRLPEFSELVKRLRHGHTAPVSMPDTDDAPERRPSAGAAHAQPGYQGMTVLWVDDHPANNDILTSALKDRGATVLMAEDRRTATRILATTPVDLLVSDVQRGTDRDAGFTTLRAWRQDGIYDGPAVFYSGRETPERQQRAEELDAWITSNAGQLLRYADRVLTSTGP